MATCDQYEHFSKGDVVRIRDDARRSAPIHDRFPTTGTVQSVTNAGFRGLEYSGTTAEGEHFWGISAADLELVEAVDPVVPWYGQGTYRDGKRVGA